MSKTLNGWLAQNNDFLTVEGEGKIVNMEEGPNYQFHKHFYKYDRHLLLHASNDNMLAGKLYTAIKKHFPTHKELVELGIPDPIDLTDIKPKADKELMKLKEGKIDRFFSPLNGSGLRAQGWAHYLLIYTTYSVFLFLLNNGRASTI